MNDVIDYWLSFAKSIFLFLFNLPIGNTGVNFGWLCVACICFCIIMNFLFGKIVGGSKV